MKELSAHQERLLALLKSTTTSLSVNELSWKMKCSRVTAVSIARALERKNLAKSYRRGDDQWAPLAFYSV